VLVLPDTSSARRQKLSERSSIFSPPRNALAAVFTRPSYIRSPLCRPTFPR